MSSSTTSHHLLIDAQGLACPMPLLKAKQGLAKIDIGQMIKVIATDPASERDFFSFVELTEHELVGFHQEKHIYTYYIRKGAKA